MKCWLITGASRGLGRAFAEAALERGDHIAATSRNPESLKDLVDRFGQAVLPLKLDVTDTPAIKRAFNDAVTKLGHLDIVVNNAGHILLGALEETTEEEVREQIETLFFGPLFMTKEAVRHMQERGRGTIVQVSSLAAVGGLPGSSMYAAGKWALESMSEALKREVESLGIRVIMIAPAGIRTDVGHGVKLSKPLPAYENIMREQRGRWASGEDVHAAGDPKRCAQVLLDLVCRPDPPTRLLMSAEATEVAQMIWNERLQEAKAWAPISRSVNYPK
jgi:NAD(P)-dependent dehydrogenase (short-subunit alcohol dehydrogenase family)